jgi:glycosyltransferase involved in cell wall biosynthesis
MSSTVIIGASGRAAAERWAKDQLQEPATVLTKADIRGTQQLRRMASKDGRRGLIVHTAAWERQLNPQRYLWWLAATPAASHGIVDEAGSKLITMGRPTLAVKASAELLQVPLGVAEALRELLPPTRRSLSQRNGRNGRAVMAIWPGGAETVGGSVTHLAGILSGYKVHGLRAGLVAPVEPPPQIAAVIDDFELASPLPARQRATAELGMLAVNRTLREAGRRLAARLRPSHVHQRHRGFLHAGLDLAEELAIPAVLEWNSAELWTRTYWTSGGSLGRLFGPLLPSDERRSVRRAQLIAAVSPLAAEMAIEVGADPDRILVVPNGVDLGLIDAARAAAGDVVDHVVGWVGSFGPWHGADLLVRALLHLPEHVSLLMIGDGSGRSGCQSLARELRVDPRVEWTGTLEHDTALQRLASCAVVVSPQRDTGDRPFFGSPTKLFEYMALGRPIVATRAGAVADLIEDGHTGVLVPQDDPVALAAGIEWAISHPARSSDLAAAARHEAIQHHGWSDRARAILDRLSTDVRHRRHL